MSAQAFLQQFQRLLGSAHLQDAKFLSSLLVIGDEELFEFFQEIWVEIVDVLDFRIVTAMSRNAEQPVIPLGFSLFGLLGFYDSDETGRNDASSEGRLIHEDKDVFGISICSFSAGNEAERVGKNHAFRKHMRKREESEFLVVLELVSTATGSFNDSV